MLKISKINPMVRAVGTMGVVAGLVAGITFAQQASNTVTLTDNMIASTTASLEIADGTCGDTAPGTTTDAGMNITGLAPSTTSSSFTFCLWNAGTAPLDVSVTSPTKFKKTDIPASDVTLNFMCGTATTATSVTLDSLTTPTVVDSGPLAAAAGDTCTVSATLSDSYTGSGGNVTPFTLNFDGTSTTTTI